MDFVASRAAEKQFGWRNRVSEFLQAAGTTVFDPWFKPDVRGLHEYGSEDVKSGDKIRKRWTYEGGKKGARERSWCARQFWETLHIDLRMVDTSDFTISYCPTNIYSVGTPHEIIMATLQHKPVLFVSPPVVFPTLHQLREHLKNDLKGAELLARLEAEIPIKENARAIPSLWYIPLVGGENFFDGFGIARAFSLIGISASSRENARAIPSLWYIPLVGGENFFDGFGFAPFRKKFGWKQKLGI